MNGPVSNTRQTVHRYFCVQEAIKYRMLPVDASAKLLTTFQCARPIDVGIFKAEPCCPPGPLDRGHQRLPFCTGPGGGDSRRRTASTASRLVARSLSASLSARDPWPPSRPRPRAALGRSALFGPARRTTCAARQAAASRHPLSPAGTQPGQDRLS